MSRIGIATLWKAAIDAGWPAPWRTHATLPVPVTGADGRVEVVTETQPVHQTLNDAGNAGRLLKGFGPNVRYLIGMNAYAVWNGGRWQVDRKGEVTNAAVRLLRKIYDEARDANDQDTARRIAAHASKSLDAYRIKAALELFRAMPGVPVLPSECDADPYSVQTADGQRIDLRDGSARPVSQADLMLKALGVPYVPGATCPTWERALLEIFQGDAEQVAFFQRLAGYCLTGDTREQVFVFFYGTGANGKSVVLNVKRDILGEYAIQTQPDLYMVNKGADGERATPQLARLAGARLAVANEVSDGARLDEAKVKQLTGGDPIVARNLNAAPFEFVPVAKHIMAGNYKPNIRGEDHGIWRRMVLVPFLRQFSEAERDKALPEKLRAEYPGILNWMIRGAQMWLRDGLKPTAAIQREVAAYKSDMDLLGQWLDEFTSPNPEGRIPARLAYSRFSTWCQAGGHTPISETRFGGRMTARGYAKARTKNGIVYRGAALAN